MSDETKLRDAMVESFAASFSDRDVIDKSNMKVRLKRHSKMIMGLMDRVDSLEDDNEKFRQALLDMGWTPPKERRDDG